MNKLGFYIQNSQGTHDHISNVQPPVILMHAWDQGLLQDIRRFRAPDAFVVGRMDYIGQGDGKQGITQTLVNAWLDGPDPAARGQEFAEHILMDNFQLAQRRDENGRLLVDAWMSLNECIPGPASGAYNNSQAERAEIERRLRAYDRFQAAFRSKLMEQGIEAVAFNFGAGNFTRAAHYLDFFPETLASYTYLGFHEYGWPAMRPDPATGTFSSAGTYRPIVRGVAAATGRSYKAIITEAGLARMFKHSTDGVGDVGWLYENDWISQDDYWASLDWYNDYLVQDDDIALGACLFQVGVGAGWQSFRHFGPDAESKPIDLLDRLRGLRDKTDHKPQPTVGDGETPPETPVEEPPTETPPVETPPVDPPPVDPPPVEPPPVEPPPVEPPPTSPGPGGPFKIFLPIVGLPAGLPGRVAVPEKVGLDANRPIDPATGAAESRVDDPGVIADTGVGWVRFNFVLGQVWAGVDEKGWQDRYAQIIAGFRSRNLKIYGLISDEALSAPPGDQFRSAPPPGAAQDPWIDRYVSAFVTIVRLFHGQVNCFESFNEPDDWHGGQSNWLHPGWFAVLLQAIHERVRADPAIRHVTLISGPVQGIHNDDEHHNNNAGAAYLRATYQEGKRRYGWGSRGPFPFDGVGYHLYVAQSPACTEAQLLAKYREYLSGLVAVVRAEEGRSKPVYLSEFGWFSNNGNEDYQERSMRLGMNAALQDPSLALIIWFSTQDFGEEHDFKFYGLYRKGEIRGENRKTGVYNGFRTILRSPGDVPIALPGGVETGGDVVAGPPQTRIPRIYTNQNVIDAAFNSAKRLSLPDPWALLTKAGQDVNVLALDRPGLYLGPLLDEVPALTSGERTVLREELLAQLALAMRWEGAVTASDGLSLRVGAGRDNPVIRFLGLDETVQVLDDSSSWLFVLAAGLPGYCSAEWVMRRMNPAPVSPAPTGNVEALRRIWSQHQTLLAAEAARLGIDPAVAVAVTLTESSGNGYGPDGRLKIRFENHIFAQRWGDQNRPVFDRYFSFNQQEQWKDHLWRANREAVWERCHQSQAQEWQVLNFARSFIEDPALQATSMGAAQIMGFNFSALGYASPKAMLDDFQGSEAAQIRGLFRYVESRRLVDALRQGDYVNFARGYNGPGQPEFYAGRIRDYIDLFNREIRGQRGLGVAQPTFEGAAPMGRGVAHPGDAESQWQARIEAKLGEIAATLAAQQQDMAQARRALLAVAILAVVGALLLAFLTRTEPLAAVTLAGLFVSLGIVALLIWRSLSGGDR